MVGAGDPVQPAEGEVGGARGPIAGDVISSRDGCLYLDVGDGRLRWIIWPDEGSVVAAGNVTGSGVLADADVLPDWSSEDSYYGAFGRYCSADTRGIVVLDEVTAAATPSD